MEARFLCDTMLGKLAKWLRIMGYDAHYQSSFQKGEIQAYLEEGRLLLTRSRPLTELFSNSFLILSTRIKDQVREMRDASLISSDKSRQFRRCILCNVVLQEAQSESVKERLPDYVYSQNLTGIRFCPSCGRHYWPGSHKEKMINQMKKWGL